MVYVHIPGFPSKENDEVRGWEILHGTTLDTKNHC